jgi:tripeptide aminopeptidase
MTTPSVAELFVELARIPSPPGHERAVAERVRVHLAQLGLTVEEDASASVTGSDVGNLYACLEPTATGRPILLCAHLDTVPPEGEIDPVIADGVIANRRRTILGADDKAAVAVMLDAVRRIVLDRIPHGGIELVFTTREEQGLQGARAFDAGRLRAQLGYVYDQASPIGDVILSSVWGELVQATFHGRAAHAGMYPRQGRSAIAAAAMAISEMRLGAIDDATSANVGLIEGGSAANVVPASCAIVAEVRSRDHAAFAAVTEEMLAALRRGAQHHGCTVDIATTRLADGYRFGQEDAPVRLAAEALRRCGVKPRFIHSGGGSDANVFNERGLPCVNLANGMVDIHTSDERVAIADLEAMVEVTLGLVAAARG